MAVRPLAALSPAAGRALTGMAAGRSARLASSLLAGRTAAWRHHCRLAGLPVAPDLAHSAWRGGA
eukprot:4743924-Prymnesium_polylepis.1